MPTPKQERSLETVVWRCRERLQRWPARAERRLGDVGRRGETGKTCGVSVTFARHSAQLPGIQAVRPEYRDLHAPRSCRTCYPGWLPRWTNRFRRASLVCRPARRPVIRGSQAGTADNRLTDPHVGAHGGAVLEGRALSVSKMGRIPIRVHRPRGQRAAPRSSPAAKRQTAGTPASRVP